MVTKRKPGAGRKPQGPYGGKTEVFTTRITPELRATLEHEARRRKLSVSQTAELLMREGLDCGKRLRRVMGPPHIRGLCVLIAKLAHSVERRFGLKQDPDIRWNKDRFHFEVLRAAIMNLLDGLAPEGPSVTPEYVLREAANLPPEHKKQMTDPAGIGWSRAHGMIEALRIHHAPPPSAKGQVYADDYFDLPAVHEALELGDEK